MSYPVYYQLKLIEKGSKNTKYFLRIYAIKGKLKIPVYIFSIELSEDLFNELYLTGDFVVEIENNQNPS